MLPFPHHTISFSHGWWRKIRRYQAVVSNFNINLIYNCGWNFELHINILASQNHLKKGTLIRNLLSGSRGCLIRIAIPFINRVYSTSLRWSSDLARRRVLWVNRPTVWTDSGIVAQRFLRLYRTWMTLPADSLKVWRIIEALLVTTVRLFVMNDGAAWIWSTVGKYHATPLAVITISGQDRPTQQPPLLSVVEH